MGYCLCCPPDSECRSSVCAYCGGVGTVDDHVIPRVEGGGGGPNLVRCCTLCNSTKGGRPLVDFLAKAVLDRCGNPRTAAIRSRLATGAIAARLGPPTNAWFGEDSESDLDSLEAMVMDWVGDQWMSARYEADRMDRQALLVFGSAWSSFALGYIEQAAELR